MLNGSLESFALADVLRFVAGSGATGRVEVEREEVTGELMMDRGRFVAARLADDEAPSTADETLDVAVLLFDGTAGTFAVVDEDWTGGPLNLDADELVVAVEKRREEWAEVVSVLGSLDDPLTLMADLPDGMESITISAKQWRLLSLVDGVRSVQDIARDGAASVYSAAAALAELAGKGMLGRGLGPAGDDADDAADEAANMLRELGSTEPADADDAGGEETQDADDADEKPAAKKQTATVRPLRVKTREEQRIRLRR
jgi:hypothetical protein